MKSVVVLQARTNSSRLPAKVLLPINGIPIVVLAAKRAANAGREVIITTSEEDCDDVLAQVISAYGLKCFRGSLDDVLARITDALIEYENETIVFRLTADNVFPDGALLSEIEREFIGKNLPYLCCNGHESGLPYGLSVEVTRVGLLREAASNAASQHDREHVTPYIIRKFGIKYFTRYAQLNKGHLRCTVDCLDDYILAAKTFMGFDKPIKADIFELINSLEESNAYYQVASENRRFIQRFVLGGAQLGISYGIANQTGQPTVRESELLIKTAINNGVQYIDTARAYGNSEEVIGDALKNGWQGRAKIITKLSPLNRCPEKASEQLINAIVDTDIYHSCANLTAQVLDVVMLHRASHVSAWSGMVLRRLIHLKNAGTIKEIGVSVQTPEELGEVLSIEEIAFIQMPYNIFDWRWDASIDEIKKVKQQRKLIIHVRSVLLQGLLTSENVEHWGKAHVSAPNDIFTWFQSQLQKTNRVNVVDLCLSFVNSMGWIDGIVIGTENMSQLKENLELICASLMHRKQIEGILSSRPKLSETTLNPALWN